MDIQQDITEYIFNNTKNEPIYLFISARPILSKLYRRNYEIEENDQYKRIRDKENIKQILKLETWNLNEIQKYVCEYFGVDDVHQLYHHLYMNEQVECIIY